MRNALRLAIRIRHAGKFIIIRACFEFQIASAKITNLVIIRPKNVIGAIGITTHQSGTACCIGTGTACCFRIVTFLIICCPRPAICSLRIHHFVAAERYFVVACPAAAVTGNSITIITLLAIDLLYNRIAAEFFFALSTAAKSSARHAPVSPTVALRFTERTVRAGGHIALLIEVYHAIATIRILTIGAASTRRYIAIPPSVIAFLIIRRAGNIISPIGIRIAISTEFEETFGGTTIAIGGIFIITLFVALAEAIATLYFLTTVITRITTILNAGRMCLIADTAGTISRTKACPASVRTGRGNFGTCFGICRFAGAATKTGATIVADLIIAIAADIVPSIGIDFAITAIFPLTRTIASIAIRRVAIITFLFGIQTTIAADSI